MLNDVPRHVKVLDIAYKLFCKDGLDALNSRNIRKAGNLSTQSVYSSYVSPNHLKSIVMWKALKDVKLSLARKKYNSILDLDIKLVELGKNNPGWFKTLLSDNLVNQLFFSELTNICLENLDEDVDEYTMKLNLIYLAGAMSLNLNLERALRQNEVINVIQNQIAFLGKIMK